MNNKQFLNGIISDAKRNSDKLFDQITQASQDGNYERFKALTKKRRHYKFMVDWLTCNYK